MTHENDTSIPNPWQSNETLSPEIKAKAQPIDYAELLAGVSVLMLGEDHANNAIRTHVAANAKQLKEAGVTHYAIEAPRSEAVDALNDGQEVDLSSTDIGAFSRSDKGYEQAVRAMHAEGIQVVPIDIDQTTKPTPEQREAFLASGIKSILSDSPEAKIAVLIGGFHTDKRSDKYMTRGLIDEGVRVSVAQYVGGSSSDVPRSFLEATRDAGMEQNDFMMNLSPYNEQSGVVFGAGNSDYVIHLAEQGCSLEPAGDYLGGMVIEGAMSEYFD